MAKTRDNFATLDELEKVRGEFSDRFSQLESDIAELFGKVTHQVESFKFINAEGKKVNDLHVKFDVTKVKTKKTGPFGKAVTDGKWVKLSQGDVKNGGSADVTFERNGPFKIIGWYWTVDGKKIGDNKEGPPEE